VPQWRKEEKYRRKRCMWIRK